MDQEPTKIQIKTDAQDPAACGPGCACGKSPLSTKAKTVVSLIILALVLGIAFYKAANNGASCCTAPADDTSAVAPEAGTENSSGDCKKCPVKN